VVANFPNIKANVPTNSQMKQWVYLLGGEVVLALCDFHVFLMQFIDLFSQMFERTVFLNVVIGIDPLPVSDPIQVTALELDSRKVRGTIYEVPLVFFVFLVYFEPCF